MRMQPTDFTPKTPGEEVRIKFKAKPAIGSDTISSVTWTSDPAGLSFANSAVEDASTSVAADVSGGSDGVTYVIKATCVMASGVSPREPWGRIQIKRAGRD